MDLLTIKRETQEEFKEIAVTLMRNYIIQTHSSKYRMTDLEFYWHSATHPDKSTYNRKHAFPEAGQWFIHYSGVDIALKNNTGGFGGILIRGIHDIDKDLPFNGPMVSSMRLFSCADAFSPVVHPHIIPYKVEVTDGAEVIPLPRVGMGQNAKDSGTADSLYRFQFDLKYDTGKRN